MILATKPRIISPIKNSTMGNENIFTENFYQELNRNFYCK